LAKASFISKLAGSFGARTALAAMTRSLAVADPHAVLLAYNQINPDLDTSRFPLYEPVDLIEYAGRWDYGLKSIDKMGDRDIIGRWIRSGEESMVEMGDATFFIECSRVVSHELVRHRLASFQQESQRYVNYEDESPEDLFILPPELESEVQASQFYHTCTIALSVYRDFIRQGGKKQIARYVLPNSTRTRIIVKANFREWRHILKLRCHKSAQPEMQAIMWQVHDKLVEKFPEAFADIKPALEAGERAAR
jgi:thymidylate synthase (FAD)